MAFPPNSIAEEDVSLPYYVTTTTMACGEQEHIWYGVPCCGWQNLGPHR